MENIIAKLRGTELGGAIELVENEGQLLKAVADISSSSAFVFDCEGVDLGRSGPLTVATFSNLNDSAAIYVVDVQTLGGDRVFSESAPSFRAVLESSKPKIMFDCRSDSDALFHQFGVKLSGVQDMQVYDQAVRVYNGEALPERCKYTDPPFIPRLPNMDKVASRHGLDIVKTSAPHAYDSKAWSKRPLDSKSIAYAAQDVNIIKQIHGAAKKDAMQRFVQSPIFWPRLEKAVALHSKRYEAMFRGRDKEVNRVLEKDLITEEHAIIESSGLPSNHPNKLPGNQTKGKEKWDFAIQSLSSKTMDNTSAVFNSVLFILQHDEWYTGEAFELLRKLSSDYPYFTLKQREIIKCPPRLISRWDDDYDHYGDY